MPAFSETALEEYKDQLLKVNRRVFEPDYDFKSKLKAILQHAEISDCGQKSNEKGRRVVGVTHSMKEGFNLCITVKLEQVDQKATARSESLEFDLRLENHY